MTIVRTSFERFGELYNQLFSDWLHIHFLIRTVLLLLVLWLIIYICAQIFQYILAPLVLMFLYNAIFRAWNYFLVETPQELIYIRSHKKSDPTYSRRYLRLCDKIKRNRAILSNANYATMIRKSKRAALRLMVICGVVSTLWVGAFGLHHEYTAPPIVVNEAPPSAVADEATNGYTPENILEEIPNRGEESVQIYEGDWLNPADWPHDAEIIFYLNELGAQETRLRNGPGITGYSVIEILWDNDKLVYLDSFTPDPYVRGLYWLRVLSPSGTEGYVSSQLVGVAE